MELTGQLFVVAEEIAYLAGTHANIAGGHIHIRTYHLIQLAHKRLTETHHLVVALATDREVGTALAATHRQCGQRVLEGLLKA